MSELKEYYYYPEVRPVFGNRENTGREDPYTWDRGHVVITQDQIDDKCSKFDKEDDEKTRRDVGNQLEEEKKKNNELQNTVDELSKILLDKYKRINELNDIIQGYKNTLKSVGLIIGSVKSREFPNQGAEYPRVDPKSFHFQESK